MPKSAIDRSRLDAACSRFGDVVIDPAVWPDLMIEVCSAVGARGAVMLQADQRTGDVPWTDSVTDVFRSYFADGWHARDIRARGAPLLLKGKPVITDEDVVTAEERRRSPFYNEAVFPFGLEWFAAIGFKAGAALWALSIQRMSSEGPFERADQRLLATLSDRLTEADALHRPRPDGTAKCDAYPWRGRVCGGGQLSPRSASPTTCFMTKQAAQQTNR
jgi:hypothetical protein